MKITTNRDPVHEIRKYVDDELDRAGDTYIVGTLAARIVDRLREDDPGLLAEFLNAHAATIIADMVSSVIRAQRNYVKANSGRSVFSDAVKRYEAGDTLALGSWLDTMYVINTNAQRKRLGDMIGEELEWAAQDYAIRARGNLIQSAFLKALAEKVGSKTVSEVYTDEQIARMWQGFL
jgi:hypothetical protein